MRSLTPAILELSLSVYRCYGFPSLVKSHLGLINPDPTPLACYRMASPAASLLAAPESSTKEHIAHALWGSPPNQTTFRQEDDPLGAYWRFYQQECEHALHDQGRHILSRTHRDVLDVVAALKEGHLRDDIRRSLLVKLTKLHENEDELVDRSIDLAARIWLMIDFGNMQYGFSGRRQLHWQSEPLAQRVASGFTSPPLLGHKGLKLQRVFNARNLDRIAGVEILPTANLLDHLRLTDDDSKLYVFHHASVLRCQSHKYGKKPSYPGAVC
jgi:hypothetical protein